jgi:hypothetical protein
MPREESNPAPPSAAPPPGLPPVEPPSGRFIVQLFVVPGLIVLAVVLVLMAIAYSTSQNTPDYYLNRLDSHNADIRERAQNDLAQILKRSESGSLRWKADAHFALELAERLRKALDELAEAEKEVADGITKSEAEAKAKGITLPQAELDVSWRKIAKLRNHVSFLASALGDLHVPVGVPLLAEMCLADKSPDVNGHTLQRRKAFWSLSNLGENTKKFADLPSDKQAEALDTLKAEADGAMPRAGWARTALHYLGSEPASKEGVVHVDKVLADCAKADDRDVREKVAFALNFWDGPLVEPTLVKLQQDNGHGTMLRVKEPD